jgi:hypothetical protein
LTSSAAFASACSFRLLLPTAPLSFAMACRRPSSRRRLAACFSRGASLHVRSYCIPRCPGSLSRRRLIAARHRPARPRSRRLSIVAGGTDSCPRPPSAPSQGLLVGPRERDLELLHRPVELRPAKREVEDRGRRRRA